MVIPPNRGANGNMDGGGKAFPRRCSFVYGSGGKYIHAEKRVTRTQIMGNGIAEK